MAKIIIQYPYALKADVKKALIERLQKDWENGLLVIDGGAKVTIHKDDDIIVVKTDEVLEKELKDRGKGCSTCIYCNTDADNYPCKGCLSHSL